MPRLTKEEVQKIGRKYFKNHGEEKSFRHTNQEPARELQDCSETNENDLWNKLIDVYESLPNNRGTLASSIEALFKEHFKDFNAYLPLMNTMGFTPSKLSQEKIVTDMRKFVDQDPLLDESQDKRPRGPSVDSK